MKCHFTRLRHDMPDHHHTLYGAHLLACSQSLRHKKTPNATLSYETLPLPLPLVGLYPLNFLPDGQIAGSNSIQYTRKPQTQTTIKAHSRTTYRIRYHEHCHHYNYNTSPYQNSRWRRSYETVKSSIEASLTPAEFLHKPGPERYPMAGTFQVPLAVTPGLEPCLYLLLHPKTLRHNMG